MKAINLLGTLKKNEKSNTEALSEFIRPHFEKQKVQYEIIKLVNYNIAAGTYSHMGEGDQWPEILDKITAADIIIFSTPVWWNNQSSEIQRVIERLDEIHDNIMEGKGSKLEGKTGGILITGDSDGAQSIISNIANFYNAIGIILPPFATLSVLWEGHRKGVNTPFEELMQKYKEDYDSTAEKMVSQLLKFII